MEIIETHRGEVFPFPPAGHTAGRSIQEQKMPVHGVGNANKVRCDLKQRRQDSLRFFRLAYDIFFCCRHELIPSILS